MVKAKNKTTWRVETYPSGTHVVKPDNGGPHLDVYGPKGVGEKDEEGDDVDSMRIRYRMCEEIASFLNGGTRPSWLDDMGRKSEDVLEAADGAKVFALGPFYDADPPACNWQQCEDVEWKDARARLIDRLHLR